jgi:hypothetical protein
MGKVFSDAGFERIFERAVIRNFEDMLDAIPPRQDLLKKYPVSERHKARMEKMFSRVNRMDFIEGAVRWSRRIMAATAVVAAVLFGALLVSSPNVRAAVGETIVQWFDEFTKFISGEPADTETEMSEWRPRYLPEGFSESSVINTGATIIQIVYTNASEDEIWFGVAPLDGSMSVNNEGADYSQFTDRDIIYHTFESLDGERNNSIEWIRDGYAFSLFSSTPIETLKLMALSVSP